MSVLKNMHTLSSWDKNVLGKASGRYPAIPISASVRDTKPLSDPAAGCYLQARSASLLLGQTAEAWSKEGQYEVDQGAVLVF